ncbi:MCP four helix bundle domain-containing protein [Daejeonella lutea]|uniref:Four helix bundle sensory module for signal transduction n=1 Tax=Daejeonella lutea TaxID=572036 RepID=A0A1T5DIE2_9SPHI|nr:MCP four helix bundle domain-containing protein [Daejeonella lutea]SKB71341.1 Four helix bundle sensory module for signal transduction [Daejeonella lutea]
MKWAFAIQRKIRLAIMLAVLMLCMIIFSLLESYNVTRISKSFNSIYEDRLIPAVDLYSIADHIHGKRNQLFTFLFTDNITVPEIERYIQNENSKLDKLINKYENTYLVKTESDYLNRLKKNLTDYRRDELLLINTAKTNKDAAKTLYLSTTDHLYNDLNKDLMRLTQVQTQVGRELLRESQNSQSSSGFISQLQFVIAIILGLIIMILVITDKQVHIRQEKYNLN